MRVITCGGREYHDIAKIYGVLDDYLKLYPDLEVISGMARGADSIAAEWAEDNKVKLWRVYANWSLHKRAAGIIRNMRMLTEYKPDQVIAFAGGTGTDHMKTIARKAGIPVFEY